MKIHKLKTSILVLLAIIGSIFIFNSCQEENPIVKKNTTNDSFFLNDQEACIYSETLFSSLAFQSLKSANVNSMKSVKKVKDITPIPDDNKLTAYYIINYEEGGFAILSADKRFSPIFAFSEDGNMPLGFENYPSALVSWLFSLKENIEFVRKGNVAATKEIQQEWKNLSNGTTVALHLKNADPENNCTDSFEQKGPLLSTNWGQGCGYNDLLPNQTTYGCTNLPCGRVYAGCVPIALAQLMKFHQQPTSYNWSSMPNTSGSSETARLVKTIHDELPIIYGCNGTGAYMSDAANILKNKFGYSHGTYSNYDYSTVVSDLRMNRPVILSGGRQAGWWIFSSTEDGHCWVCDGFTQATYCIYDDYGVLIGANTYLLLHMNWGWSGNGNGWFSFNNFNPTVNGTTYEFNYGREMIHNIAP